MKKFTSSLVVAVVSLASSAALACGGHSTTASASSSPSTIVVASQDDKAPPPQKSETTAPAKTFKMASVDDVQKAIDAHAKDKKPLAIFDANGKSTRDAQGILPTAILLPSSSGYDLALLPKDKATPTVFYCANERCTASHTAAKRALDAGYTDVSVLAPGIAGWVKAGKATERPPVG